jgi:hypothetical protein
MPMRLLRNHEVRILLVAAFAAALAIVAMLLMVVVRINQTEKLREVTASNCRGLEAVKGEIRGVFEDNLERTQARTDLSVTERTAIVEYYNRQIRRFAPHDCPSP